MDQSENTSFGVFKPVGHVVIAFPAAAGADATAEALAGLGVAADAVHRLSDRDMLQHIERDLARASPLAAIGQELNLIKAHQALAERGYHWLVVRAIDDDQAARVAECARRHGAERAQYYGRFIIEELIQHAEELPQVSESPDRGLDVEVPAPEGVLARR